jgi:hypothetical protein
LIGVLREEGVAGRVASPFALDVVSEGQQVRVGLVHDPAAELDQTPELALGEHHLGRQVVLESDWPARPGRVVLEVEEPFDRLEVRLELDKPVPRLGGERGSARGVVSAVQRSPVHQLPQRGRIPTS